MGCDIQASSYRTLNIEDLDAATDATGQFHHSSPVILPAEFQQHWLDTNLTDRDDVDALLNSIPEPHLEPYGVSTAVNSPRNNTPELLRPVHQ